MKTILVIDEDAAVRDAIKTVLQTRGFAVGVAAHGQEALEQFDPAQVDVVLLDANLPQRQGWAHYDYFRIRNPFLHIILLLQGHPGPARTPVLAGVRAFLEKPFDAPQLLSLIDEVLRESGDTSVRSFEQSFLENSGPARRDRQAEDALRTPRHPSLRWEHRLWLQGSRNTFHTATTESTLNHNRLS